MFCSILLPPDDDGNILGDIDEGVERRLELLALLAAGQIAQHRLILALEILDLDVRLGNHRRDGPSANPETETQVIIHTMEPYSLSKIN